MPARMPSTEIWLRALAALQAAAHADSPDAIPPAVEDALDGLSQSELMRVAVTLAALGSDHIPRALLPADKRGHRRRAVAHFADRFRLEITWRAS